MADGGGDAGPLADHLTTKSPVVVPGGRADLVVVPTGVAHQSVPLLWVPFDRGFGSTEFRSPVNVFRLALSETEAREAMPLTAPRATVEPLSPEGATPVEIDLTQQKNADGALTLGINGVPFDEAPPISASVGETQLWTVRTKMQFSHPFHLHGFFFQPLGPDGMPTGEWRDTMDVPHTDGELRFLVRYDNRPGMWMFHCHILDHADAGMMGMVDLRN